MMVRAKLLGAVLAALMVPAAMAGDITKPGKIAPSAEAQETTANEWNSSGLYLVGLGAYDTTILEAEGLDLASGNLMAGAAIGYNIRVSPSMVLGIEADWMFTGVSAVSETDELLLKASTDHLVTIRARAGIPLGPALVYVTAGPAWQHVKLAVDDLSDREWHLGAALGAGAEIELTRALFVRLEAIHYVFPEDGAPLSDILDSDHQHTTARVGVGFKLN